jgi:hypothetical protein
MGAGRAREQVICFSYDQPVMIGRNQEHRALWQRRLSHLL